MAQTGFTPISTYYTTTASAVPTAGNLVNGELALNINTADGKLFYKDSAGVVQVLATRDATSGSFVNLAYTGTLTGGTGVVNLGSGQFYKDASGNVGIGTSSPTATFGSNVLQIYGTASTEMRFTSGNSGTTSTDGLSVGIDSSSIAYFYNRENQATVFGTNNTERMRIDSNGNLLLGMSSAPFSLGSSCQIANASGLGQFSGGDGSLAHTFSFGRDNVTTGAFVFTFNGSVISQIGAGTGIYTPVSDSRLKKNITPLKYGLNEVLELNPVMYNMKTESDDNKKHIGLLAQEVKSVMDESVNDLTVLTQEMKNAGAKEQYYGLDKSGLVPVLIKAIQELNAKVTALETQLGVK